MLNNKDLNNKLISDKLRKILAGIYIAVLIAGSALVVLEGLFISKNYASFSNISVSDQKSGNGTDSVVISTESEYEDQNKEVSIKTYQRNSTKIYVGYVTIKDNESIKTALANETYGKNVKDKTSDIADNVDAVIAINGDFYGARNYGYVIRNGKLLRNESQDADQEDLVIYEDGSMEIIKEGDISAEALLNNGAVQVMSFGPALVEDGEIAVDSSDEVGKAMASNPRTAVGIIDDNHYVFVVSDGRTDESRGLSLKELAEFMKELNVKTAYNLDGGGSSTMYFNGRLVNKPTTNGSTIEEREVSDIVYI